MGEGRSCIRAILFLAIAPVARATSYDALVYPLTPPSGITVTTVANQSSANGQAVETAVDLHYFLPTNGTWNGSNAKSIDAAGDVYGIATGTFGGLNSSFGVEWVPTNSSSAIVVAAGAEYQLGSNPNSTLLVRSIGGPTINTSGTAILPAASNSSSRQLIGIGGAGLLLAGSSGAWTGKLDLANNDLDLPASVNTLANITNQIHQAFDGGKWDGSAGITSSSAAANSTHLTTLGVMQNNQSGSALYITGHPFDTIVPGAGDVLVKYTYYGDANLDGTVNSADYARIDAGYVSGLHGWFNGDFNYDGIVDYRKKSPSSLSIRQQTESAE